MICVCIFRLSEAKKKVKEIKKDKRKSVGTKSAGGLVSDHIPTFFSSGLSYQGVWALSGQPKPFKSHIHRALASKVPGHYLDTQILEDHTPAGH